MEELFAIAVSSGKIVRNRGFSLSTKDPKQKTNFARERDTSSLPCPLHARALTGDRARERGAENCADAPRKHERRRRERRREKKYDFSLSVRSVLFFCVF